MGGVSHVVVTRRRLSRTCLLRPRTRLEGQMGAGWTRVLEKTCVVLWVLALKGLRCQYQHQRQSNLDAEEHKKGTISLFKTTVVTAVRDEGSGMSAVALSVSGDPGVRTATEHNPLRTWLPPGFLAASDSEDAEDASLLLMLCSE